MAVWNSLPGEMQHMVLQSLIVASQDEPGRSSRKPKLSRYVTVCRFWKDVLEPSTFRELHIKPKHLADFENYVRGDRRCMLRHLWFRVELAKRRRQYTEQDKIEEEEDNNALFTTAIHDLFTILRKWGRPAPYSHSAAAALPRFELELGAQSPGDPKWEFGDAGITSNEDYSTGELDFCFVDGLKKFSYPSPLPEVSVVSTLSILRRTRRYFAPQALLTLLDSLPGLREVRYEPWYFLNQDSQADVDEAFGRYIRHWPSSVTRISIYEHCKDFRRHFPGQYTEFDDAWFDENADPDGLLHHHHHHHHHGPHDDHFHAHHHHHHHYHHHHHHHDEEESGWVDDDGDSADDEGWETANEDDMDVDEPAGGPTFGDSDDDGTASPGGPSSPTPHMYSPSALPLAGSSPLPAFGLPPIPAAPLAGSSPAPAAHNHWLSSLPSATGSLMNVLELANALVGGPPPPPAPAPLDAAPGDPHGNPEDELDYPEIPHLGLGLLFIRPSQQLEELAVSGLIDARDFFEPFYGIKSEDGIQTSLPSWERLRWLTLTSPILLNPTPIEGGADAVNELLQAAGRAAARMPKLQVMELYCTDARGGVVFRYQVTDTATTVSWQSAWAPIERAVDDGVGVAPVNTTSAASVAGGAGADGAGLDEDMRMNAELISEDDEEHPRHFRVGHRVVETWAKVARRHTRNDLDPVFETTMAWSGNPFGFIHENLVTRELVLHNISSKDILRTHQLPEPGMELPVLGS